VLSALKNLIRSSIRPVSDRVWPRVEVRVRSFVEPRFRSLEAKSESLEEQTINMQAQIAELQLRIASLDKNWQDHVPVFLRATSTVVSFERELTKLKDLVLAREKANSSGEVS
jgi:chromosome segregation ATPase